MYDVLVVGGGPAGLSAALVLGRCRRRVLICDDDHPRNEYARGVHGFLTRDGIPPQELRRIAHDELRPYENVEFRPISVTAIERANDSFTLTLAEGDPARGRKLLLATGVMDDWPEIAGAGEMYGKSIHHCPYCDGWEWRDTPIAIYGQGTEAYGFALEMIGWTRDIVLCADGPASLAPKERQRLERLRIGLREERIICVEGDDGYLERIRFAEGEPLARKAIFFTGPQHQRSIFAAQLGCEFSEEGAVRTDVNAATCVPGLYVAGDASRHAQFSIVAASEGVRAAEAINTALLKEDLARLELE